ncbi:hypothetical protein [Loktanella sp. M215]|uniref:hypothetical protein n=1 Tax=Loktanella sp. M215 TaxID=2675431 RepID=UPI001F43025F|nr:hypothetical protein [Loktanella sp. M215]MCF7701735.1 hypothetical protein [Loktanella sp. M215]
MRRNNLPIAIGATIFSLLATVLYFRDATRTRQLAANPTNRRVRNAGPDEMRDPPPSWTQEDERSDESFPASDPPGTY